MSLSMSQPLELEMDETHVFRLLACPARALTQ
ncbi:hypothetical protein LEMLEM_LOCUS1884 [Lemmus lemmus]